MISYDNFFEEYLTIMKLSPKDALDFVINHSYSERLVQSLPEENFYFFVASIGISEAGPIIALGSEKQWEYLLDIEIWNKETLNYFDLTNLLILMANANLQKFIPWCFYKKKSLIELYLFRNIKITIVDNEEDYPDFDDISFTNDGIFYISLVNFLIPNDQGQNFLEKRKIMIKEMLLQFSNINYVQYQDLLLEVMGVIPAETEEELLRFRNVRLAEKGFLPFYEAVGIYQPIKLKDVEEKGGKTLRIRSISLDQNNHIAPYSTSDASEDKNLFLKGLKKIDDDNILQQLKIELGALCNLVISADNKKIRNYEDLKNIVNVVTCFLSIGIELMLQKSRQNDTADPCDVIKNWNFNYIFRLGYTQIHNLKQKVKDWRNNAWFISHKLKLHFWEEEWFGILGGLLLERPMFFEKSSFKYRNFREYSDIYEIGKTLEQIIIVDNMLRHFSLNLSPFISKYSINVSNLLLNTWFLHITNLNEKTNMDFYPIPLKTFKLFYNKLWEEANRYKEASLYTWVAKKMNLQINQLPKGLILFLDELFLRLKEELFEVSSENIDPKYIDIFIID